jgi:hypothetical protein
MSDRQLLGLEADSSENPALAIEKTRKRLEQEFSDGRTWD